MKTSSLEGKDDLRQTRMSPALAVPGLNNINFGVTYRIHSRTLLFFWKSARRAQNGSGLFIDRQTAWPAGFLNSGSAPA